MLWDKDWRNPSFTCGNVQVTPGDGTLTVTWTITPREGVSNDDIRNARRWSRETGVWANPPGPSGAAEDGIVMGHDGGMKGCQLLPR